MSRKMLALLALVSLPLAAPAFAITYGEPDGGDHPNVGALIRENPDGTREIWCSGTLISPTVFLTAAHCVDDVEILGWKPFVTFDQEWTAKSRLYSGTLHLHPDYTWIQNDPYDVAVIVFAQPVRGITPASLPSEGLLDRLDLRGQKFTAVGYGVHEEGGPFGFPQGNDRWRAVSSFHSLTNAWLRLSQNPATGDGGTCYGDSGGPNFLGAGATETPIIASLTVTGDRFCKALNATYRLDTESARSFLGGFVTLP